MTRPGDLITTFHEFDEGDEHNVEPMWALREPEGDWTYKNEATFDAFNAHQPFVITPGQPVYIYDRNDIAGLRKLLDAIEARFDEEGEDYV